MSPDGIYIPIHMQTDNVKQLLKVINYACDCTLMGHACTHNTAIHTQMITSGLQSNQPYICIKYIYSVIDTDMYVHVARFILAATINS